MTTTRTRTRNAAEDAARAYLSKGFRVVPMRPGAKRPSLSGFGADFPDYTAGAADFGPRDGVAILCGPCPALGATADDPEAGDWLMCVDLDGGLTRKRAAAALGADLPRTLATHGNAHLWYRVPASVERGKLRQWNGLLGVRKAWAKDRRDGKAPDLDLKWCGGYARELGEAEAFDVEAIAELPLVTVRAILGAPGARKSEADDDCADTPCVLSEALPEKAADRLVRALVREWPAPGAGRHDASKALGGTLRRAGVGRDDTKAIAVAVMQGVSSDAPETRVNGALNAWDRVDRGDSAYGRPTLLGLLEGGGRRTHKALDKLPEPPPPSAPAWAVAWAQGVLERVRSDAGYTPSSLMRGVCEWAGVDLRVVTDGTGAVTTVVGELDSTGLHLHPLTGWPWILQSENTFWLHLIQERRYDDEIKVSELDSSVARDLAGLVSEEDRTPTALRGGWIKPVKRNKIVSTYTARTHTYDPETRTLTLAALRWTELKPKRHVHIDRWLRALFGGGYGNAAEWLASCMTLHRPAPCLYLPGPRGLGKSLLADGLARLWSKPAPVPMAEAIDNFNEATGECPLVFTDEGFPERLDFAAFRRMVTAHSRRVNRKHVSRVDVEGCGRFIIAANNEDVLRYQKIGTLTRDDLDAIADRLLVVPCRVEARAVLDENDDTTLKRWAKADIAEHVLWLAETVTLEPEGRMAARPGGGERILAGVAADRNSVVLTRIGETLGAGALGEQSGVLVPNASEVWVNVPALRATFDDRVTPAAIRECCDAVAVVPGSVERKYRGRKYWVRVLDRARLDAAIRATH